MFPTPIKKKSIPQNTANNFNVLLIIVSFVVLLLIVVGISVQGIDSSEKQNIRESKRIKKVKISKSKKKTELPRTEKKDVETLSPQKIGEIRDGKILLPSGRLHAIRHEITSGVTRVSLIDKTFVHETDCMLAQVLVDEPGVTVVGDINLTFDGFDKNFLKTLDDPIVYDKNDTPYVKELKMGVQSLRQELKERMDKGEDINAIMVETYKQMQELGLYRQELEEEVIKLSGEDLTQKDYEDLISAANQMLQERGSKPLELPSTLRHAIRLRQIQEETAAKAKKGNSNEQ